MWYGNCRCVADANSPSGGGSSVNKVIGLGVFVAAEPFLYIPIISYTISFFRLSIWLGVLFYRYAFYTDVYRVFQAFCIYTENMEYTFNEMHKFRSISKFQFWNSAEQNICTKHRVTQNAEQFRIIGNI